MNIKNEKTKEGLAIVLLAVILMLAGIILIRDEQVPTKFIASKNDATNSVKAVATSSSDIVQQTTKDKINSKVNINKASAEELDTLPGVGVATAAKIIDYRNSHGGFKTLIELKEVSGIGDVKYEAVKNLISI